MSPRTLKTMIAAGDYRPSPDLVAEAMLQRRGIRTILSSAVSSGATGHGRADSVPPRPRAA